METDPANPSNKRLSILSNSADVQGCGFCGGSGGQRASLNFCAVSAAASICFIRFDIPIVFLIVLEIVRLPLFSVNIIAI
jgi:hypothetical protein